jgi:transglutaminase-like putative cysteine protease
MQSASPSPGFHVPLVPGRVWGRTRDAMTWSSAASLVLILLLALTVAKSTATVAWVGGLDVVVVVALGAALLMGVLAVTPLPWAVGLGVGLIAGPIVAAIAAGPALHAAHPGDTLSLGLAVTWWTRIVVGSAPGDPEGYALSADQSFYLYLICLLMWVTGGWLSWCVLRWRRSMLGLVPGAAAFATNLLNYPADQTGYMVAMLVLTLALLLWTNYTSSIASATRARVRLTGDARWDFWESGLAAMAALILLALVLPPLSTVDRTVQMESSAFSSWAQLQEKLNHAIASSTGAGGGATAFSTEVSLGGPLTRTHNIVFNYTFSSSSGPRYFRGVDETQTWAGEWRYPTASPFEARIPKDTSPSYSEVYKKVALTAYDINMLAPPAGNSDILFYPGSLYLTDRASVASQSNPPVTFNLSLNTIDRLSSQTPLAPSGTYNITTEYSIASVAELRQAGTAYEDWLAPYTILPKSGYRSQSVLDQIHQLAVKVTVAAGAVTPYDKAKAIETYLRDPNNFQYTLTPPSTPDGKDRLWYFLFVSKKGYCEFFASAMGDMLRSLGIPTRLVNGFGPGIYNLANNNWVVRGEDAHTWVESYFPGYGWITFEPTPDGVYFPIDRGAPGSNVCLPGSTCDTSPGSTIPGSVVPPVKPPTKVNGGPGATAAPGRSGFALRLPDAGTMTKLVGILLALLLFLFAAAARYLRPRSVMMVWNRTLALAHLAGAERRAGETPFELGRRLARTFPEASESMGSLTDGFVVAAYAPPDLAASARASVMDAWAALRPLLLRRVASRLRAGRA